MINITVDTSQFNKAFKEYMRYSKRSFPEACNQHAYYIARNAVMLTKGADKGEIEATLMGSSNKYPGIPLAAILVNKQLKGKGEAGINGNEMARAVRKYVRQAKASVNFVKSGWIPAIKRLALVVPKKGGSPIPPGTDKVGRDFGGASPATGGSWNPIAYIWNSVQGSKVNGDKSKKVRKILEVGAQRAINMETKSMRDYIVRKQKEIIKQVFG